MAATALNNCARAISSRNTPLDMTKLHAHSHLLQRRVSEQWCYEVDDVDATNAKCSISYTDIFSTLVSVVIRAASVYINIQLAYNYYYTGQLESFRWTTICIMVPMCITTLIYANMCHQDGKFSKGTCKALQTLSFVFLSSFLFRYWNVLVYGIKCKWAELKENRTAQLNYYKLTIREESDVAFIRLFECFLEAAPQKILQISIVLMQDYDVDIIQIIAICSYFGSMAWCLAVYHRYNRYAQVDKFNINSQGLLLQLCWHFCISVSRTICIALIVCLFPFWAMVSCLSHAVLFGFVTFITDRPHFSPLSFLNLLFCFILGVVYLFTYIAVKDSPTRSKYWWYYSICSLENAACVAIFLYFAVEDLGYLDFLHYLLCALALAFYYFGIVFMIIYYLYFHPKITARKSKRIVLHNI